VRGKEETAMMNEYRAAAIEAARAGGEILVENLTKEVTVDYKGAVNLVTNVDRQSEKTIVEMIKKKFPDHEILAEEGYGRGQVSPFKWIIDPLDGTTNYAHHFPFFCVSIGLEVQNEVVLGVVYDPIRSELFLAEKGKGAVLNDEPIAVSATADLMHSLLVTGFSYDVRETAENNFNHFFDFSVRAQGVRRTGSAALDFCYVAMGRFDGFWELKLHPWDAAAGSLIVQESGGRVTDFAGKTFSIYSKEVIASNGKIHDQMIKVLQAGRAAQRQKRS
jgi:myo-inositol-1(or 4)-monophosphatase